MSGIQPGLTLITGGVRAGKSRFAERLAVRHGEGVLYVATAEALDDEMRARIAAHQAHRPATWRTLEAPLDPSGALRDAPPAAAVVLDCLTVWASNILLRVLDPDSINAAAATRAEDEAVAGVAALLGWQRSQGTPLYVVSNEVGLGVVPPTPLGRVYQDVLGRLNQRVAAAAERVYLVHAGLALELRAAGAVSVDSLSV
jgi:adenosyl cobinamide kinase/adenosyl cobinamide phosphate guanylyltransferase